MWIVISWEICLHSTFCLFLGSVRVLTRPVPNQGEWFPNIWCNAPCSTVCWQSPERKDRLWHHGVCRQSMCLKTLTFFLFKVRTFSLLWLTRSFLIKSCLCFVFIIQWSWRPKWGLLINICLVSVWCELFTFSYYYWDNFKQILH